MCQSFLRLTLDVNSPNGRAFEYPVVMLAIERSERAGITTGKAAQKNVAEGDPLAWVNGAAVGDDKDGLRLEWGILLSS